MYVLHLTVSSSVQNKPTLRVLITIVWSNCHTLKLSENFRRWDKYCLQFVSTIIEGNEEAELSEITLTITSCIKKEAVETLTVKIETQKHAHIMQETVKVSRSEKAWTW